MFKYFLKVIVILIPLFLTAQTIVINEVMSSNAITFYDEEGDAPDWIELFNAGSSTVNLFNYGISDNENNLSKWIFPDVNIDPEEYLVLFASGKDRSFSHLETVIDWGDEWKYYLGYSAPPEDWRQIDFDDSIWLSGPSGIGCGDGDDATIIPTVISYFLRHKFTVTDTTNLVYGILHVDYDDAFVAYLNGTEIARANIGSPGIPPAWTDTADSSREALIYQGGLPEQFLIFNLNSLLQIGDNVLAIQTHNVNPYSTDLTMIPFLTFAMHQAPPDPQGMAAILEPMQPLLHTNFKISAEGEPLFLTDENEFIIDSVPAVELSSDISYGLQPDGSEDFFFFDQPTPGEPNTTYGYQTIAPLPEYDLDGGFYTGSVQISLSGNLTGDTIYYTLDGTEPGDTSYVFIDPIIIDTTTVVRARILGQNSLPSRIITNTYFIDREITLPVISLSTTPANFFDWETGIYVMGPNANPHLPYHNANFWQDWEKPIHIEMFNPDGSPKFKADAGTKIHGRWSRAKPQKSLAVFFRGQYGVSTLYSQVFDDKPIDAFESLLLRNSGNEWMVTNFRDGFVTNLMEEQNIDYQEFQPVITYLNGQYWGIYNLREKVSEHFVASNNPGVDPDNIDRLEYRNKVMNGDSTAYHYLKVFMANNDLSDPDNYEFVKTQLDAENLTKYLAHNIYCANRDWPRNNVAFWRERTPWGKFRWALDDMDWAFAYPYSGYEHNTLQSVLSTHPSNLNLPEFTFLFRMMFTNQVFYEGYINCTLDYMNTIYQPSALLAKIAETKSLYETEMPAHIARWDPSFTMDDWYYQISKMETFAQLRPENMLLHLMEEFATGDTVSITLNNANPDMGCLKLNFIELEDFPFNGFYFENIPVHITAVAQPGYEFVQWNGSTVSTEPALQLLPAEGINLAAHFQVDTTAGSDIVINEINYNSSPNFNPGDWLEIYNNSGTLLDLSGWQFRDEDDSHIFVFPAGFQMQPQEYYVLCQDTTAFTFLFPDVDNYLGNFDFGLSNGGEELRIFNVDLNLIDNVIYDDEEPWPPEPDGNGPTLELKNPNLDNLLPQNWAASSGFGTPGQQNSAYVSATEIPEFPRRLTLYQNFPNPFNPQTTIQFYLPDDGRVDLKIFNIKGQLVRTFRREFQERGLHSIIWDSRDDNNKKVASGIYLYQIKTGNSSLSKKMLLLK